MKPQTLLSNLGYKSARDGTGRYRDPVTEKLVKRSTALDRAAQMYTYKNYAQAKEAWSSKAYARIVGSGYDTRRVNPSDTKTDWYKSKLIPKGQPKNHVPSFAEQAGVPNDYRLQKLFADAWKARNKDKSKELAQLLKYVKKINKYKATYAGAL